MPPMREDRDNMITFKDIYKKTQIENNKDITHIKIANGVVDEFLKSDSGKDLDKEVTSIISEEYENLKKEH